MADQPRRSSQKATRKVKKGSRAKKWFYVVFFTAALAIVCGIIGYLLIILNGERILAENQSKLELNEASIVYDSSGKQVARLANENYENAEYSEIPEQLKQAVIATEDKRFEEHSGIDLYGIGRALVKDIIARSAVEGASTITQQLARNLFLNREKTFFRKATEASIAVALENKLTKDEILTMYLNRIYYGNRVYGVKLAAKYYFNSSLEDLKLWQIATLAGIPKAPNYYNPEDDPERSKQRRAIVLQLMYQQGIISKQEMDEAKAVVYKPIDHNTGTVKNKFPSFVDYAVKEAMAKTGVSEDELQLGGFKIYTTLNANAQQSVEDEFADDDNFEKSPDEQQQQAAMIIMDHSSGGIKAMLGGRGYVRKGLNRVTVVRQPGSAFKPISVYGPALETGDYFPWTTLRDDRRCYGNYCPSDSNANKFIGPVSMSQSVKESRNASAVWLLNEIGVDKGIEFAKRLGIPLTENDYNLSLALGGLTKGVTPLQMATAYSAFANDGRSVEAHTITKIVNKNDETVYEFKDNSSEQIMKPSTAAYMTELLQEVVSRGGTGSGAAIDRPVAGKTGTTQHGISGLRSSYNRDAWFVGYTPEWTAAVWMGYDKTDREHLLKKSSKQAAALFAKVMTKAMKDVPRSDFKPVADEERPNESQPPSTVQGLSASYDKDQAAVNLTWNPVEGGNLSYRVYRKASGDADYTRLMDAAGTEAKDMNVSPGMTYEYYVTAYNADTDQESGRSSAVRLEIPAETLPPAPPVPDPGVGGEAAPGEDPGQEGNGKGNDKGNGKGNGSNDEGAPEDGSGDQGGTDLGTGIEVIPDPGGEDGTDEGAPADQPPAEGGDTTPPDSGTETAEPGDSGSPDSGAPTN